MKNRSKAVVEAHAHDAATFRDGIADPASRAETTRSAFFPDQESLRHFQKLRDEQLRGFDEDYSAWIKERDGTWISEFENWRSSRNSAYGADPDRTET